MPLQQSRTGQRVAVKKRPIPFSFWPARSGRRHHALQSLLFARDPWLAITQSIKRDCPKPRQPEALACLEQAKDFYAAGTSAEVVAARPLALYYGFMNLVKAYCLTRGARATFDKAQHGLSAQLAAGAKELIGASLDAHQSLPASDANNFDEFLQVYCGVGLAAKTNYPLPILLPQIVPGHRFWSQAAKKAERFIQVHDLQFWHDPATKMMWLRLYFVADDLSRLGVTQQRLLTETRLAGCFVAVACNDQFEGRDLLCFEQVATHNYPGGYPADEFQPVIAAVRDRLWATVATVTPYRRYYVYLAPVADHGFVLPQLLSIYAIIYHLGSITRYRPHQYDNISKGPFGPWVQEFVNGQPLQFLYLMASEFARQDVTKPSIL
jgi:hypothetical protein